MFDSGQLSSIFLLEFAQHVVVHGCDQHVEHGEREQEAEADVLACRVRNWHQREQPCQRSGAALRKQQRGVLGLALARVALQVRNQAADDLVPLVAARVAQHLVRRPAIERLQERDE